ncbi:MAG: carboxypeptidase-like regulatory domain-containing protein, partial [Planctomycetota bacterium]
MNPKFVIPIMIVAIVAGLLFYFLGNQELTPGDRSNRSENAAETDPGSFDPDAATAGDRDETKIAAEENAEVPDDATPILIGQVSGGGVGVPDASVLLFPVAEIERSLLRMEDLIPGGELPNFPELIGSIQNELLRFKSTAITLRTDENGEYRLYGDHEGGFIVLSYAKGWLFHYGDVVSLLPETTSELFITLDEGASISGQVVRSSGQSVAGIKVLAEYRPPGMAGLGRIVRRALRYFNGEFLKGPFETRTDSNGNFTISSLPPGTYDLLAYDSDGLESYAPNVETGTNSAVIYFGEGGRITGILTDEFGMPLGRLPITLERIDETLALPPIAAQFNDVAQMVNRFLGEPPREILTQDDGSFEFHPLGQGQYKLTISQSGFYPYKKQIALDWHEEKNVGVIALPRGQAIRGVVISDRGEALEGATIIATRTDQAFMGMASTMTDFMSGRIQTKSRSDGSFELAGLQKGKYSVNATLGGYVAASENNVEPEGDPLELVLGEGGTLRGIVTDPTGQPVPGVRVRLGGARGDSDEEGRFVIRGVSPDGRGGGFGGPGFGMQMRFRGQGDEPATGRLIATLKG